MEHISRPRYWHGARIDLREIYKYLGRSRKSQSLMQTQSAYPDSKLEKNRRSAKSNLRRLVYGERAQRIRSMIGEKSDETRAYLKELADNIGLLLASRLQLDRNLERTEGEMSVALDEYIIVAGGDSHTYNSLRRLFSHPTDLKNRCYSWLMMKGYNSEIENAESARGFIRVEKMAILRKMRNVSKRIYKMVSRIEKKMYREHKIVQLQELEEPEDIAIIADAIKLISPQANSIEDLAKDPDVMELISS